MVGSDGKVGVALIGVTGYGNIHVNSILAVQEMGLCRWVAACDRDPKAFAAQDEALTANNVQRFDDLNTMLDAVRGQVQLIGIPVGIPYHAELSIRCMEAGYHVLCEKPTAATIQEVDAMIKTSRRTGMTCQIGFQRSWSPEFLAMRELICGGRLGTIKTIRAAGWWKRADSYYTRNVWAGKLRYGDRWVLDGTINNPFAHQIHAAMCLASSEVEPTVPTRVRAELYHCREITGEDTSGVTIEAANGAVISTYFTTCTELPDQGPIHFKITGEKGTIDIIDGNLPVVTIDGSDPYELVSQQRHEKSPTYEDTCRYLLTGEPALRCPVEWTRPFMLAVNGAFESSGPPRQVDPLYLSTEPFRDTNAYRLAGIDKYIQQGYETGKLYSDLGAPWATASDWFDIPADYAEFNPSW